MRYFLKVFLLGMILIPITGCNSQPADTLLTHGPDNGHLILVGGNMHDPAIYAKFMELAGGPDANIVLIVTAASDEELQEESPEGMENQFRAHGFKNLTVLHTRDRVVANSEAFTKPIEQASGLWFRGGRQWRLVDAYQNTRTYDMIKALLDRGGVVGGSSAGATIQGSFLVRGDTKTNTIMMGDHLEGFNFLTNSAVDQHLLAMNRQFDIFEILDTHPHLLGIGIDENTAIVVDHSHFEVIGQSYVAIYDGTFCQFLRDGADWSIERPEITELPEGSKRFYLLGAGRKYSLIERRVVE